MKRLAIVTGALALIFIVAQQLAQAQQCTAQDCIYLPAAQQGIGQAAPTVTPLPTTCDDPTEQFDVNIAWLTNSTITPGEPLAVCVRPSQQGTGIFTYVIVRQRSGSTQSEMLPNEVPPLGTSLVLRFPLTTDQFGRNELIVIDVFSGGRRITQVYLMTR